MDDKRRVAMVETKTVDTSVGTFTPTPRMRFQLDDQIWSARFECDETGLVISYEEFHPYGTSAYRSARSGVEVSERRFRYTGKERDDETGFQIHGLRYYVPWLGRWTTSDPIGLQGGLNGYGYCRGDPVGKVDPGGTDSISALREASQRAVDDARPKVSGDEINMSVAPEDEPVEVDDSDGAGGAGPVARPDVRDGVEGGAPSPEDAGQADRESGLVVIQLASIPFGGAIGVSAKTAVMGTAAALAFFGQDEGTSAEVMLEGLPYGLGGGAAAEGGQGPRIATAGAPGGKVKIGNLAATELPKRLSHAEMAALQTKHGTEFAQIYLTGPGKNGGGGKYYLLQGSDASSVSIPVGPNVRWISHSHPEFNQGARTPLTASVKDQKALRDLQRAGSPQKSSFVVPEVGQPFRFDTRRTHGIPK